ncbi:MAG: NAD kinase [Flavobacteriales bacterium]|nr:NAD kinase [Flavobacteriales bacterium]MCB9192392.1 NAD kinase [Flavobacteriales bacterium]MCB9204480.1 NAD kinase [Flavobacteriales bacterium]
MRIAVHGRLRYESDRLRMEEILRIIDSKFQYVSYSEHLVQRLGAQDRNMFDSASLNADDFDVFISVGGDGTLLDSVRKVGASGIPILGVNTGRLGFLSSTPFEELENALERLKQSEFKVDKRTLVKVETEADLFGDGNFALNELSVHKSATSSMLVVHAYLDDFFLNTYWADGLIISTPTGSTGYSLSTGGPIVAPATNNIIISPIAPHNLNVRPLVISDSHKIRLKVEETDPEFMISLDSQSKTLSPKHDILVSKADFEVGLIRFGTNDYFNTLRSKLMWGHDRRN